MNSELRAALEQLGPIRAVDRVRFGFSATVGLSVGTGDAKPVSAILALAKRGLTLDEAKSVYDALIQGGNTAVTLPCVEDIRLLTDDLRAAGVRASEMANSRATG